MRITNSQIWISLRVWPARASCVGGPLVFENGFVAKSRITTPLCVPGKTNHPGSQGGKGHGVRELQSTQKVTPLEVLKLDDDFMKAMRMMEQIEEIRPAPGWTEAPGGSPSCRKRWRRILSRICSGIGLHFPVERKVRHLADRNGRTFEETVSWGENLW